MQDLGGTARHAMSMMAPAMLAMVVSAIAQLDFR
jgi:hypothetical protein